MNESHLGNLKKKKNEKEAATTRKKKREKKKRRKKVKNKNNDNSNSSNIFLKMETKQTRKFVHFNNIKKKNKVKST